jgi:hypothetical protein
MARLRKSMFLAGMLAGLGAALAPALSAAADLQAQPRNQAARCCGTCGCLQVAPVRHKELRSTYGIGFDPRNYDGTEPHYYFGPVRSYPRYWVSGDVR